MAITSHPHRTPTHPGEFLADFLDDLHLSQIGFARVLGGGWTQSKINQIIKAKRGITPATALVFADAFGNSPEFWMNAQRNWDLWHALQHHVPVNRLMAA